MILVVGATGRLGKAVAELLLREGTSFRAACRNVDKAKGVLGQDVDVVHLDVERGSGFAEALHGATQVLSCIHGLLGRSRNSIRRVDLQGQAALIDAAVEAGVGRFVYMSALGASPEHPSEFWRAKASTERYLKTSGLGYVILRPSAFMDLYAHDMIGAAALRGRNVFLLGDGTTPRNLIAVADVADAALRALVREDLANQTIEIGGFENPTEREIAALYARLSGKSVKVRSVPPLILRTLASAIAPFHAGAGHLLRLPLQLAGREDMRLDASSMIRLGISPLSLREYVESKLPPQEATG